MLKSLLLLTGGIRELSHRLRTKDQPVPVGHFPQLVTSREFIKEKLAK
jgi:hypothetical protein